MNQEGLTVSSAELVRRFGSWQDRVATDPVFVTHHGRRRLVLLSPAHYEELLAGHTEAAPSNVEMEDRFSTLCDQIDCAFVVFDEQLRFTVLNPAAALHFRISRDRLMGEVLDERIPDVEQTLARAHIQRSLTSGETASFEAPSLFYPGEWLRFHVFPYGTGVGCLFRNITVERKLRQVTLAEAAFEEAIQASGGIGFALLSLRGTFSQVDTALANLIGFPAASLLKVRLTDVLPLRRRMEAGDKVETILSQGGSLAFPSAILTKDGAELDVTIALAAIQGDLAIDGATVIVSKR